MAEHDYSKIDFSKYGAKPFPGDMPWDFPLRWDSFKNPRRAIILKIEAGELPFLTKHDKSLSKSAI